MQLRSQREVQTSTPLGEFVCRNPLPWIIIAAMLAAVAAALAWHYSGRFAYSTSAEESGKWLALGVAFLAFLGGVYPAMLFWHEATGSTKLRHPRWVLGFSGLVLATSTFVIAAQLFRDWKDALQISVVTVFMYCVSRVAKYQTDKKSLTSAAGLDSEQCRIFLSIAEEELFDSVSDAHTRAPDPRGPSVAGAALSNPDEKKC